MLSDGLNQLSVGMFWKFSLGTEIPKAFLCQSEVLMIIKSTTKIGLE